MATIYVLLLENDKYYIGKTTNLKKRILDHELGNGSSWTKKYKMIKLVESFISTSEFDEDNQVKKYMKIYGIENVRGGSYCQIFLSNYSYYTLKKELYSSEDLCFNCGRSGHFINNCDLYSDDEDEECNCNDCNII